MQFSLFRKHVYLYLKRPFLPMLGIALLVMACSTQRNNLLSRNSHALSTKYNILYNGGLALDKGIIELRASYQDNFWEILPIERLNVVDPKQLEGKTKNPNFDLAETKATKAIQKHSMFIDGTEKNYQIDEAHLMLGMARYYEQRFIPALEAFNYVLYKYPTSSVINEVKIWREKTNMRLNNDDLAVTNLTALLRQLKLKNNDKAFSDAHATMAQAYLNTNQKDSAITRLKTARLTTKNNDDKARYTFIIGQIYESIQQSDSAYVYYQRVIDMKRKSPRQYVIQAHAHQGKTFNPAVQDTTLFLKKMADLLADRENRPYLDVLHHQLGLYYDKKKDYQKAIFQYNRSLFKKPTDTYLKASDYRNIAQAYFNSSKYVKAGMYFDSTLTALNAKSREYKAIKKKRDNLNDVIKYEAIAQSNDSILSICALTPFDRETYYQKHIDQLKKAEVLAAIKSQEIQKNEGSANPGGENAPSASNDIQQQLDRMAARSNNATSSFYFYTASTVSYGREQFKKIWGDRSHKGNWRTNSKDQKVDTKETPAAKPADPLAAAIVANTLNETTSHPEYEPSFYTAKLPKSKVVIDSLAKERNFAYYQLAMIYKEKFKEYERSSDRFERLLRQHPEERLVLPSLYHLYKVYEIIDKDKAEIVRQRILKDYPNSRYAELLSKKDNAQQLADAPRESYDKLYKAFQQDALRETYPQVLEAINLFTGEDLIPKFELLKSRLSGRLFGLKEYAQNLNYVALNYPNTSEGREAEKLLGTQVMALDALAFSAAPSKNWKIVFPADPVDSPEKQELLKKLTTFTKERTIEKLTVSVDLYTMDNNLFVIHGFKSEANAQSVLHVLKEYKDYLILDPMYVITADNYKVVQIKKCLVEFISGKPAPAYHFSYKAPTITADAPSNAQPKEGSNESKNGNDSNPGQPTEVDQPNRNPKNNEGQNMPSRSDGLNGDDPMPGNVRGNQKEPAAFPAVKKP